MGSKVFGAFKDEFGQILRKRRRRNLKRYSPDLGSYEVSPEGLRATISDIRAREAAAKKLQELDDSLLKNLEVPVRGRSNTEIR
jgi:hypothetical protein